jgi:uncharacterized protein (DUF1499 family)
MTEGKWTPRLSRWALRIGTIAIFVSLGGALLARFDVIPKLMGLNGILAGAALAALGSVAGLLGVIGNLRSRTPWMRTALIGLLISGGHFGFMASRAALASNVPAIHDVTTDLQSPPSFVKIPLAADNLRGVGTVTKWRDLHASAYSKLSPLSLRQPADAVFKKAEALARAQGWEMVSVDPTAGRIEATATVSVIGYKDDVVITVAPSVNAGVTTVNMRSVSRVGISDLGVNAKRIGAFLVALEKA